MDLYVFMVYLLISKQRDNFSFYRLNIWELGSIPGKAEIFLFPQLPDWIWNPNRFRCNRCMRIIPSGQWPWREAAHSTPYNAEV
jgi:hypothetical protein